MWYLYVMGKKLIISEEEKKQIKSLYGSVKEGLWSDIFGKPDIKDAKHTQIRGKGYSHTGKEEEKEFIMFNGEKYYEDQIEYADYNDLGELPRVEDGKLIIANPAWSL